MENYYGKRGPKRKLTIPEVMTLNIMRIMYKVMEMKAFHALAKEFYKNFFANLLNYENFMKATNKSGPFIATYFEACVVNNRNKNKENVFYIDSKPVPVCNIRFANSINLLNVLQVEERIQKAGFMVLNYKESLQKTGLL